METPDKEERQKRADLEAELQTAGNDIRNRSLKLKFNRTAEDFKTMNILCKLEDP